MTLDSLILFLKANSLKLWATMIPAGFFALTANEILVIQLLFITLWIDIILGIALAVKMKRFSSHQMGKCMPRIIGYCISIILLLVITSLIPEAGFLLFYTLNFFILREVSSHIENLALLGVKFPDKFMLLINNNYQDKEKAKNEWMKKNKDIF